MGNSTSSIFTLQHQKSMSMLTSFQDIVGNSYCVGCGVCAYQHPQKITMRLNKYGNYVPFLSEALTREEDEDFLSLCPFSNESLNETQLSQSLFDSDNLLDEAVGSYSGLYVGYSPEYRQHGSSGGLITWILATLINRGYIDHVIHVRTSTSTSPVLFEYSISSSVEQILAGAKSKYYPIELSHVLAQLHNLPGRLALVALPCFTKAVRNLAAKDATIDRKITFYIGLVCGHLKSTFFADSLALQTGINPDSLCNVDFRVKKGSSHANKYYMSASSQIISNRILNRRFIAGNWGLNFFRNPACNYCDDVFAETADIVVGDAWISPYASDPKGTSIVIVRSNFMSDLIAHANLSKDLVLDEITLNQIIDSQRSGLADRREGLAYRLYLKTCLSKPFPNKRINPSNKGISYRRKLIYRLRLFSESYSNLAFVLARKLNSYPVFLVAVIPVKLSFSSLYLFRIPFYLASVFCRLRAMLALKRGGSR